MSSPADHRLTVSGNLTMDTVPALYAQGVQHLARNNLLLDFGKIDALDSSAVSLLLAWARVARENKRELQVVNLPASLSSLADLYGVSEMLPASV